MEPKTNNAYIIHFRRQKIALQRHKDLMPVDGKISRIHAYVVRS